LSHVSPTPQTARASQARPQVAPLFRFVSQPSSAPSPSSSLQSAKPGLQLGSQAPLVHARPVVFVSSQARPQAPQSSLVVTAVSQPSSAPVPSSTLQSSKPALQVGLQAPAAHARAVVLVSSQARSQAPQSSAAVFRLVSQPSSVPLPISTLQSSKPVSHTGAQAPATQARVVTPS
jgi:hypothetical protein